MSSFKIKNNEKHASTNDLLISMVIFNNSGYYLQSSKFSDKEPQRAES